LTTLQARNTIPQSSNASSNEEIAQEGLAYCKVFTWFGRFGLMNWKELGSVENLVATVS